MAQAAEEATTDADSLPERRFRKRRRRAGPRADRCRRGLAQRLRRVDGRVSQQPGFSRESGLGRHRRPCGSLQDALETEARRLPLRHERRRRQVSAAETQPCPRCGTESTIGWDYSKDLVYCESCGLQWASWMTDEQSERLVQ